MYCKHCGKEVDDGSAFCPNCGKILESYVSYAESYNHPQKENLDNPDKNKPLNLYFGMHKHFVDFYSFGKSILVLLFFVVLFGVIAFLAYLAIKDDDLDIVGIIFIFIALSIPLLAGILILFVYIKSVISSYLGLIAKLFGKEASARITNTFSKENMKVALNKSEVVSSYYIVYEYNIGRFRHQTTQRVSETTFYNLRIGQEINIKRTHFTGVIDEKYY